MIYNILVVDDNQPFLNLVTKLFEKYRNRYAVHTCLDGLQAINMISKMSFTAVVTDLQMPNIDGYALLKKIKANFPDVPVIVITSFDKPKTGIALKRAGAYAYFTKPLNIEDLLSSIEEIIASETEGGRLHNASLEMFIQLIEMEAKTCTIRVNSDIQKKKGVLFFGDGELFQARYGLTNGIKAAYEVFSWEKVTLSIENRCVISSRQINVDLQAILLEAMRLKDEIGSEESEFSEETTGGDIKAPPNIDKPPPDNGIEDTRVAETPKVAKQTQKPKVGSAPQKPEPLTSEDVVRNKLSLLIDVNRDIDSINMNAPVKKFVTLGSALGKFLNVGEMKAAFFDQERSGSTYLVPSINDKYIEVQVRSKCLPDKIIESLTE